MTAKTVREFSAAGPCLTLGLLVRETARFYVYYPWISGRKVRAQEKRTAKRTPAHYSPAHVEPCNSCCDHPRTQYPEGYTD